MKLKIVILALSIFALFACDSNSRKEVSFTTKAAMKNASGAVTNEFSQGEIIYFDLSITNNNNQRETLKFANPLHYDIEVYDQDNNKVWFLNDGRTHASVTTEFILYGKETRHEISDRLLWDQKLYIDLTYIGDIPAGNYTVKAFYYHNYGNIVELDLTIN